MALIVLGALVAYGLRLTNVYRVPVSHLIVRAEPVRAAEEIHVLETGTHVLYLGEDTERDGFEWIRVSYLQHPSGTPLEEWTEGWIAKKGRKGLPFVVKETNPFRKMLIVRSQWKLKAGSMIQKGIAKSPLLSSVGKAASLHLDKAIHAVIMCVLGIWVFLFILLVLGVSLPATLLASILVTNLLGLLNELLDLATGKGSFEMADLAANAMGSAVILPLFVICLALKLLAFLFGKLRRSA